MKKVLFISSVGGHLDELLQLSPMFEKYDYHIATEKGKATLFLKDKYKNRVSFVLQGTTNNTKRPLLYALKLLIICFQSLFIYIKVRPKVVITTGAHTAGPMCCLGKIFGSKVIYIESFANSKTKSITGRVVYLFADLFVVQWEEMLELYPKATYGGWIY